MVKSLDQLPKKKVLMLSYHYPPAIASGCMRIKRFVDNLPFYGYEPLVVTVKSKDNVITADDSNVFRASQFTFDAVALPDVLVRKLWDKCGFDSNFRLFERLLLFPDNAVGFVPSAVSKSLEVYKNHGYDLIYVTCKPFSTALAGVLLKKKLKLPLVLDFRDPYALDYHEKVPSYYSVMRKYMEKFVLKYTDYLITNTKGGEQLYKDRYKELNISVINNGFDFRSNCPELKNDKMIISHAGHLYGMKRDPDRLFAAMAKMQGCKILFRSIGDTYKGIMQKAKFFGIEDKVEIIGNLPHEQALAHIYQSDVLFLSQLPHVDRYFSVSIANKSFEYLETGKPVIADLPEGDNAELFRSYSSNSYVITDKDPEKVYLALRDLYGKWQSNSLKPKVNPEFIAKFNGRTLTGMLSDVFNSILGKNAL